jgi:hypothetical protein
VTGAEVEFRSTGEQKIAAVRNEGDGVYTTTITSSKVAGTSTITASVPGSTSGISASASLVQSAAVVIKPVLKFIKPPKRKIRKAKVKLRFKVIKGQARGFQCRVDRRKWAKCKSPKTLRLKRGKHVIRVRAVATDGTFGKPIVRRIKRVRS